MELENTLKELVQTYGFLDVSYTDEGEAPSLEVCLVLTPSQINKMVSKANSLNRCIASCADILSMFGDGVSKEELLKTTVRCAGSNKLYIRTHESMVKMLVEMLFD